MAITVLIADDADWSAITLEVLVLTMPGATVVRVANGQDALAVMSRQDVSAIITDLCMPEMDGFELIERARTLQVEPPIPIVLVTADGSPEARAKAQQLDANSFFVNPYSPAAVRHALETLLNKVSPWTVRRLSPL